MDWVEEFYSTETNTVKYELNDSQLFVTDDFLHGSALYC